MDIVARLLISWAFLSKKYSIWFKRGSEWEHWPYMGVVFKHSLIQELICPHGETLESSRQLERQSSCNMYKNLIRYWCGHVIPQIQCALSAVKHNALEFLPFLESCLFGPRTHTRSRPRVTRSTLSRHWHWGKTKTLSTKLISDDTRDVHASFRGGAGINQKTNSRRRRLMKN